MFNNRNVFEKKILFLNSVFTSTQQSFRDTAFHRNTQVVRLYPPAYFLSQQYWIVGPFIVQSA